MKNNWFQPIVLSDQKREDFQYSFGRGASKISSDQWSSLFGAVESALGVQAMISCGSHEKHSISDQRQRLLDSAEMIRKLTRQLSGIDDSTLKVLDSSGFAKGGGNNLFTEWREGLSMIFDVVNDLGEQLVDSAPGRRRRDDYTFSVSRLIGAIEQIFPDWAITYRESSRLYKVIAFFLAEIDAQGITTETVIKNAVIADKS